MTAAEIVIACKHLHDDDDYEYGLSEEDACERGLEMLHALGLAEDIDQDAISEALLAFQWERAEEYRKAREARRALLTPEQREAEDCTLGNLSALSKVFQENLLNLIFSSSAALSYSLTKRE